MPPAGPRPGRRCRGDQRGKGDAIEGSPVATPTTSATWAVDTSGRGWSVMAGTGCNPYYVSDLGGGHPRSRAVGHGWGTRSAGSDGVVIIEALAVIVVLEGVHEPLDRGPAFIDPGRALVGGQGQFRVQANPVDDQGHQLVRGQVGVLGLDQRVVRRDV